MDLILIQYSYMYIVCMAFMMFVWHTSLLARFEGCVLKLLSKGPNVHIRLTNRSIVYYVHGFWAHLCHLSLKTWGLCLACIFIYVYWNYGWMDLMLIQCWHIHIVCLMFMKFVWLNVSHLARSGHYDRSVYQFLFIEIIV